MRNILERIEEVPQESSVRVRSGELTFSQAASLREKGWLLTLDAEGEGRLLFRAPPVRSELQRLKLLRNAVHEGRAERVELLSQFDRPDYLGPGTWYRPHPERDPRSGDGARARRPTVNPPRSRTKDARSAAKTESSRRSDAGPARESGEPEVVLSVASVSLGTTREPRPTLGSAGFAVRVAQRWVPQQRVAQQPPAERERAKEE